MQGNVLRKIHVTENPTPFYLEFTVQRAMSISESKEIKKKKILPVNSPVFTDDDTCAY